MYYFDWISFYYAVAHNITTQEMGRAVLHRIIDNGIQKCSAAQGGGPQWTSAIYYGSADTTNGNIGDS